MKQNLDSQKIALSATEIERLLALNTDTRLLSPEHAPVWDSYDAHD